MGPSGFGNSSDLGSGFGFSTRTTGLSSGSRLPKPRLVKHRKQSSSQLPRPKLGDVDLGFNPFQQSAEIPPQFSGLGRSRFEVSGNEPLVFGAGRSDPSANLGSKLGESNGIAVDELHDELRKMKLGDDRKGFGYQGENAGGVDKNNLTTLEDDFRKMRFQTSKTPDDLNVNSKDEPKSTYRSMASELPDQLKKLNVNDARTMDGAELDSGADNMRKFNEVKGSSVGNEATSEIHENKKKVDILDEKAKYTATNESEKSGLEREAIPGETTYQFNTSGDNKNYSSQFQPSFMFSSGGISYESPMEKSQTHNEFAFTSRWDGKDASQVKFTTPYQKGGVFAASDKVEFNTMRDSVKDAKSKKKRGGKVAKPFQPTWIKNDFVESADSYSPMDISPYPETLAENRDSRETSVTSEDAYQFESQATVPDHIVDEDLVFATQKLDIGEGNVKDTETKGHTEEYVSGGDCESFITAAEHFECSVDTFASAADFEEISSRRVESEVSSGEGIERQHSDVGTMFNSSSMSEDVERSKFTFSASSSSLDQSSVAATRHLKKKNRVRVAQDLYSGSAANNMQFFPLSRSSSILSPRQAPVDTGVHLSRMDSTSSSGSVKEKDVMEEVPSSSAAAQEACEKWRLRGNQAYSNGDMLNAEEYYSQGLACISERETSRSCLRAVMLCYSNRAASRMSLGKMREAISDCKKAASIDPSFLRVHVRAANCYLALGEVEDASLHFMKCLQPGTDACVDRKLVLEASEGLEKAQKVLEYIRESENLLQGRTSTDAENALGLIAEALTISAYSEKLVQRKADALFMLQKYEDLILWCEQTLASAAKNCPSNNGGVVANMEPPGVLKTSFRLWRWYLIIKSYFYLGRLEEALAFMKKEEPNFATEMNDNKSHEPLVALTATIRELLRFKTAGNEAFQAGKYAEAIEHYSGALSCTVESRPFAAVCFCNRAAAYKAMNQIADAIAECSLAIALDGNYVKAISRRATLFEMIRDYEQASMDLRRLVSYLTEKVEKSNQSVASYKVSLMNELKQAQLRLSTVEEEARNETSLNMYLILGVDPSATESEIKKAYRKAALRHHPDKASQFLAKSESGDDGFWKEIAKEVHKDADRLFKMIGESYAILYDSSKRARYDQEEEMRNILKNGNGGAAGRMKTDFHSYQSDRSNRRQWQEVWRSSYGRGPETTRSNRYP
ncbi:uncharacterized protein LOC124933733 [Impatiens glandulifera]|uniref:uncharacterized protein LOC124933733 n=1 Tax=Impatiens glandulifera TaxID=253017 RepID=UPI001FB123A6|nr:uncharacterized protein LOC124933733 [Impatiens glandulifera]